MGMNYEVVSHTGGDLFVLRKDRRGKTIGWSMESEINIPAMGVTSEQSISGKGWDFSSLKYTNDIYLNLGGGISYRGGYHADKDGIGVQWGEAGNTGNMPVPLPDGTKLEDFWNVEWELTVENDVADWKTVAEVAAAVAAIAALVWVTANDLTIIGVLDDALIVPICTYLATSAPALYQHFINAFPQLQGIVSNVSNCME